MLKICRSVPDGCGYSLGTVLVFRCGSIPDSGEELDNFAFSPCADDQIITCVLCIRPLCPNAGELRWIGGLCIALSVSNAPSRVSAIVRTGFLRARPHTRISSRQTDAYYGQIGNGEGNGIAIVPAFATRKASRGSVMTRKAACFAHIVVSFRGLDRHGSEPLRIPYEDLGEHIACYLEHAAAPRIPPCFRVGEPACRSGQ